ncbi:MAG: ATPase [Bacteroidetes bacterium 4484_276]|nr:MAG: ATPase [Bacteroidetes bacterium 4484_276]OYT13909.1 MAG: ATPase [Bacteroidetes bacterium 4572_114]
MDKRILQTIIADQQSMGWQASYIERSFPGHLLSGNDIVVFSGIRRCGKSTLLHQIRKDQDERDFYMNFDDDRLIQFSVENFQMLLELFIELFGPQKTIYFDEIQNIYGWERFIRRLYDYGYKVFITGSNATMLSRELGTHLSGRHISYKLFPFSFSEYLRFNGFDAGKPSFFSTENRALAQKHFSDYFIFGGFPAYIKLRNPEYLKSLYESILYRDVMVRNNLGNEKEILELVFYLASNVSKLSSYNSLSKIIGVSNASTVKNYISYLQNSYLIFPVNKYDFSLKKQIQNPKKIYFIDNALIKTLGFYFTDDLGRMLENLVFLELKRRNHEIFYHTSKTECDFLVRSGNSISVAIQVSYSLSEKNTRLREINGLLDAMQTYALNKGMIITNNEEENLSIDNKHISIVPAWKWLLERY